MSAKRSWMLSFLMGCAAKAPPQVVAPVDGGAVAIRTEVEVGALDMFEGDFGHSLIDRSRMNSGWLDRMLLPDDMLRVSDDDVRIEPWAQRLLLLALSRQGAMLIVSRPDGHELTAPMVPATSALRSLEFVSGIDDRDARVLATETGFKLVPRSFEDEKSLCGPMPLPVPYVTFKAVAQRTSDGAALGWLDETVLIRPIGAPAFETRLPPPTAPGFCDEIAQAFRSEPTFVVQGSALDDAGNRALSALRQLWGPVE